MCQMNVISYLNHWCNMDKAKGICQICRKVDYKGDFELHIDPVGICWICHGDIPGHIPIEQEDKYYELLIKKKNEKNE